MIFLENKRIEFLNNIKNKDKFLNYKNIKKEIENLKNLELFHFQFMQDMLLSEKKFLISLKNDKLTKDQTYLKLIN